MKHIFTVIGIAAIFIVALTVTNVGAQSSQPGVTPTLQATSTPTVQITPTGASPTGIAPNAWNMSMHGGMRHGRMGMGGGMMGGMMGGGMHGQMNMSAGCCTGTSRSLESSIHEDVAQHLGMTTQDLDNHLAAGKSMVQVAAEKGINEQQLMNAIMASRQSTYDQAVKSGYMTQAQADAMLQYLNSNLHTMLNQPGYGINGWGRMWNTQPTLPAVP